jgi:two-component system, NtrC family, response regulator AtoC
MTAPTNPDLRRVLVVDDEENLRHLLLVILKKAGYDASAVPNGAQALKMLEKERFGVVLCDVRMPVMDGLQFLEAVRAAGTNTYCIMMSAYGTTETAIEAMKLGAYDYISKPFKADEILLVLRKVEEREALYRENIELRRALDREKSFDDIIGQSEQMKRVFDTVAKVAPHRATVLLTGESGTGKELLARAIHRHSDRADGALVPVNCGAIPDQLLETELFGHARGSFTGAVRDHQGLFEQAHQGTLFLDEIAELPLLLQVKLLRTIEDGVIRRIGDSQSHQVDVRLVAATGADLQKMVRDGLFREDLFYRLNVINIHVPPLRDRREDIPLLADHFVSTLCRRHATPSRGIEKSAMRVMLAYGWPGNVRELENVIERAVLLCDGDTIALRDLPDQLGGGALEFPPPRTEDDLSIKKASRALEAHLIERALRKTRGNRTHAAKLLEISHRALLYKMRDFGVDYRPEDEP